jgi:hypothetical protein
MVEKKIFCKIVLKIGGKPKDGGASRKVLRAQEHFPQPMSECNTTTGEIERPQTGKK